MDEKLEKCVTEPRDAKESGDSSADRWDNRRELQNLISESNPRNEPTNEPRESCFPFIFRYVNKGCNTVPIFMVSA